MKHIRIFFLLGVFVCTGALGAEFNRIVLGGFSPDASKLLLNYCEKKIGCAFGYYDFSLKRFIPIVPPDKGQGWGAGGFSGDGKKIVVTVLRQSENGKYGQIAIVDLETKKGVELTHEEAYRQAPSFSHDGKKILFARANRERTSGMTRFSDWDIYEVDLGTGSEKRLTQYDFFSVSSPAYLPDDRRFIFSGEAPSGFEDESGKGDYKAYRNKFGDNDIFILDGTEKKLAPLFMKGRSSSHPHISHDGTRIVYAADVEKEDGIRTRYAYDLFLFEKSAHTRITRLQTYIMDISMSFDGGSVAFVTDSPKGFYKNIRNFQLWLLNIGTGALTRIDLDGALPRQ